MAPLARSALPVLLALGACAGPARPTTMRTLSSLSSDPQERDEELATSEARPGPEHRPRQTAREQRVETAAATAVAIVASWFSHSPSVVIGVGAPVDENLAVGAPPAGATSAKRAADDDDASPAPAPADAGELVPWVRFPPRTDAPASTEPN